MEEKITITRDELDEICRVFHDNKGTYEATKRVDSFFELAKDRRRAPLSYKQERALYQIATMSMVLLTMKILIEAYFGGK